MRDSTERPEAVAAGTVKRVGTDSRHHGQSVRLLGDGDYHYMIRIHNPYGDGHASEPITAVIAGRLRPTPGPDVSKQSIIYC